MLSLASARGARGTKRWETPVHSVQVAEKTFAHYEFVATNPGGHSARPTPDNAIHNLAEALVRLGEYKFPVNLNAAARLYFERNAPLQNAGTREDYLSVAPGAPSKEVVERLSKISNIIGMLRTTCVATMASAGHAPNALAQTAKATINCRVLPQDDLQFIENQLGNIAGSKVEVNRIRQDIPAPASPLNPALMASVEKITAEMWPGVPVIPTMGVSTSDNRRFRAAGD